MKRVLNIIFWMYCISGAEVYLTHFASTPDSEMFVSLDQCSDSVLAYMSTNGHIYQKSKNFNRFHRKIAGDSASIFKTGIGGNKLICKNDSSIFLQGDFRVLHLDINKARIDTIEISGEIVSNITQDHIGNVYFESYNNIYLIDANLNKKKMVEILPGKYSAIKDFDVIDSSTMLAVGDSGFYFWNGDSVQVFKNNPGYSYPVACLQSNGQFVTVGAAKNVQVFDPASNDLFHIEFSKDFSYGIGNGYPLSSSVINDKRVFCSNGWFFSLRNDSLVKEAPKYSQGSSVIDSYFFFAVSYPKKFSDLTYIAERSRIFIVDNILEEPVSINRSRTEDVQSTIIFHVDILGRRSMRNPNKSNIPMYHQSTYREDR